MTVNMTDDNVPVISAEDGKAKALEEELENLSISSGESYGVSVDEDLHSITSQELSRDDSSTESVSCDRCDSNQPDKFGLDENANHFSGAPQDLSPSSSWDKNEDTVKVKRGIIHDDSIIIDEHSNHTEKYDDYQLDSNRYSAYEEEDEQPMSKPRNDLINTLATIFSNTDGKEYMKWETRVQNKLCYRESYIPVPREQRETEEFFDKIVPDKKAVKQDEVIYQYLFPTNDDPKSIVLKREHVTISKNYEGQDRAEVKELILLNHCLIILRVDIDVHMSDDEHIPIVDTTPKSAKNKARFFQKRLKKVANLYEACHPLSSIISIEDSEMEFGDVVPLPSFQLKIRSDKNQMDNYKIHCFSLDYKLSWISALRTSVTSNIGVEEDSIYASVLCNDLTAIEQKMIMLKKHREEKDLIDKVNGYSPLHLAILTSKHLIANQLLRVGANPNTVAKDGSSPLSSGECTILCGQSKVLLFPFQI